VSFLGDGTFGRVIEVERLSDNMLFAMKVIRPVERYIESAILEAEIITNIQKTDVDNKSHCVRLVEFFSFREGGRKYLAIVFEKLGKSLYEFIKANNYRGFSIEAIREFARQIFEGIGYLHEKLNLTHTDLKVNEL
jgi:serine/threonine protein kinase